MNRVRIVAFTAVALGAVVLAGTKFQESRQLTELSGQPAAAVPLASVASAPSLTQVASAPARPQVPSVLPRAEGQPAVMPAADLLAPAPAAPQPAPVVNIASASILSAGDLIAGAQDPALEPATTAAPIPLEAVDETLQAEIAACAVWVVVTPSVGAMLDTSVYAPCDRDAAVQVSHAGLVFDTHIGADGQLMVSVPALIDDATVTVTFVDGRMQSDTTFVSDLGTVERVALQWTGAADLTLHAYEFGAQYGDAGHIYAANTLAPGAPEHGFLTVLGDSLTVGARVQVYSYPTAQASNTGSVALEIEVPITEQSCGKPLEATSIEMHGSAAARSRQISIDMPACDGAGGYVVLPGILPDLRIAALR